MERVFWIAHKGKDIFFSDYSNLGAEELAAATADNDRQFFPQYENLTKKSVLALVDVTGSIASKASIAALKTSAKLWQPLYKKQAVIGLTPFHHIFLNAVNKFSGSEIVAFKTKKEALDWLVR